MALMGLCLVSLDVSANQVSFLQAWDLVQSNNQSLAAERAQVQAYRHFETATGSLNLPSISLGASYVRLDDDVTVSGHQLMDATTIPGLAAGSSDALAGLLPILGGIETHIADRDIFTSSVRAVWPIFTGGRISAAQSAAEGRTEEAKSHYAMELQARYEDLSRYYFSVVLAREVLRTRQAVEVGLAQHLEFAEKLEQQGQIAKVERLQAQASLDKAKVETRKAQSQLVIAQSALDKIMSIEDSAMPQEVLFINQHLPPMQAYIEQTLSTYPGLALLSAKEQQASSMIKAERGKYLPEVYLFGDYSLHEDDTLASQLKPDWMVGISVSVPLTDTSGRRHNIRAAKSLVQSAQLLQTQAHRDLSMLVQKTYLEAQQAIDEVIGLESSIALAQENLRLREKAFNQGLSSSIDVVDAQLYLASIQTQQSVARYSYLIGLTRLLALSSQMETFTQYQQTAYTHSTQEPV
ncbi:TolC family protein [Vibrio sp. WXL103]|uniref:TolC family protein n=1 Tax=Vibrio sp. WXL103 TaxID=3450710 RepID=UPI003EC862E1